MRVHRCSWNIVHIILSRVALSNELKKKNFLCSTEKKILVENLIETFGSVFQFLFTTEKLKKMPNVDRNSQFRPLFFKWRRHKKSLPAFAKYTGLSRLSNVTVLISNSHERHATTTFTCGWNVRWSTTLCHKRPKLTALSNTLIPQDISENSFYFITKADIKSVKNKHKANLTLKSQRPFGAKLWW